MEKNEDFWKSFKRMEVKEVPKTLRKFKVYLFRAEDCIRNWLSYINPGVSDYTLLVEVEAETSAKAKNRAITLINAREYDKFEILDVNHTHHLWGLNNFPELKEEIIGHLKTSL